MARSTWLLGRMSRRPVTAMAVLALAGGTLAACSPGTGSTGTSGCGDMGRYGTFPAGTTVTVGTAFSAVEAARFDASVARFEECTGIDVVQSASNQLEVTLRVATATANGTPAPGAAGTAELPDLAVVPQPGLVAELVEADLALPMPEAVGANVELGWERSWSDVGTIDGTLYAAPLTASVKSFVWYSPTAFEEAGYEVPETWDDLVALADQVVADHPDGAVTPWCLGISDGETTGWPATDWLEDAMLSIQGTSAYDAWADHDVALDSAPAVEVLDALDALLLADGHVPGGRAGAASTTVEQAGEQLVSGQCLMLHASSSYETMLPPGTIVTNADGEDGVTVAATPTDPTAQGSAAAEAGATDASATDASATASASGTIVSAFLLPSSEEQDQTPLLVGGDYLVALSTSEAIEAVMAFLTSAEWAQTRVELGGLATANRGVDVSEVSSDVTRRATEMLQSRQTVIRLDASDSMPSVVGTDALWSAMTQWTVGDLSGKEALTQAEAAWPEN